MPRKPRQDHERIRNHYSKDLRMRIIYQYYTLHRKTTNISINLNIPLRVVQRTLECYRRTGEVCNDRKGLGRQWTMRPNQAQFMLALIANTPDMYLDEIRSQLIQQHGLDIALSTIWRTLKKLGMTSKKLSRAAAERSEDARRAFGLAIGGEEPNRLVFADESAVNIHTTYRENGWAFHGQRARKATNFVRGKRYSILPALSLDGIIYSHIKKGSYNGDDFLDWLSGLLEVMNPYPARNSVLILDNCRIHHVEGVEELCQERGVKLVYLPPYSPDFNPIEESFSSLKAYIRRKGVAFRALAEVGGDLDSIAFLYDALEYITPVMARAWFSHSGYM